jgi:hypothetical protein
MGTDFIFSIRVIRAIGGSLRQSSGIIPNSEVGRDGALRRPRAQAARNGRRRGREPRTLRSARWTRPGTSQRDVPTWVCAVATSEFELRVGRGVEQVRSRGACLKLGRAVDKFRRVRRCRGRCDRGTGRGPWEKRRTARRPGAQRVRKQERLRKNSGASGITWQLRPETGRGPTASGRPDHE